MTISEDLREHILAWLRANGIDPNIVPAEPYMTLDGDRMTTDVYQLDDSGHKMIAPGKDKLARTVATFTVTPPPADVAEWLRPRCPECGR